MKLTEQLEEIALRVATTDPDCIRKGISPEQAKFFATAFLAALPKPEPVGEFWVDEEGWGMLVYEGAVIDNGAKLYTAPPQPDDVQAALDFMIQEECHIVSDSKGRFWLRWEDYEQVGWFNSPREAIDAAIAAAKGEV